MYGKENPTNLDKIRAIWNYQSPEEELVQEQRVFKKSTLLLRYIAMLLTIVALFLYVDNHEELSSLLAYGSFILFGQLVVQGIAQTRNFNSYAIRLWLLALFTQIPFVLLTDSINLNSVFIIFAGALLIKGGIKYLPLYTLFVCLVPTNLVWLAYLIIPLLYLSKKHQVAGYILIAMGSLMFSYEHSDYNYLWITIGALMIISFMQATKKVQAWSIPSIPRKLSYYGYFLLVIAAVLYKYLLA